MDELGIARDEGRGIIAVEGTNILFDVTKGIQYLNETMDLIVDAFKEAMNRGPLANEKVYGLKVRLVDAKLHEDSIHRGPAQTIPAARSGIYGAMCLAGRVLLEPLQKVTVNIPQEVLAGRHARAPAAARRDPRHDGRRRPADDRREGSRSPRCSGSPPTSAARRRARSSGRRSRSASRSCRRSSRPTVVSEIRQRRGLKPEPYDASYYSG